MSVTALYPTIERDYELTEPDRHVIVASLLASKKQRGKPITVKAADLVASITGVASDRTMKGAPSLTLSLIDPMWRNLLHSNFFDVDADGRLDNMDMNYPDGSRYWWRLHQLSPKADHTLQAVFLPRTVAQLMDHHGPIKANRASRTRAEFLKMLSHAIPELEFYSKQLDVKQPVGTPASGMTQDSIASSRKPSGKAAKTVGLGANAGGLTIRGAALSQRQQQVINTILQAGDALKAPTNALIAAIYAAAGESNLGASSANVFQTTGVPTAYNGGTDTAGQARGFFTGGTSFGGGGAIRAAHRGHPPWMIANETEVNAVWLRSRGDSYAQQSGPPKVAEAAAIVQAGGGGLGAGGAQDMTIETVQPYYFQINTGEDYWTGMNRLAQEVNWELCVDGDRLYYDSDMTLIRQQVAGVIDIDDRHVLDWSYDWDNRHLVTEMRLQLIIEKFEFHAGEVLHLTGFGAASTGSTAKLPGRWLISEMTRNAGDAFSELTLVQATAPQREPAPQVTTQTVSTGGGGQISQQLGDLAPRSALAAAKAAQIMSAWHIPYSQAQRNLTAHPPSADCSSSTSWMLWQAGFPLPGGVQGGQWAPVSGAYEGWGAPGRGRFMTVWCNADHIFTEFTVPGIGHMQFNTSGGGNGPRWFAWGANGAADAASGAFTARHWAGQ